MPSRLENAFRIRDILDNPMPDAPNFHQIFRVEIAEEQDIINELNNSGNPWTTQEYTLNYNPSQATYPINVTNFGKPILALRATGNCLMPWLPVPIDDLEEMKWGKLMMGYYATWGIPWVWGMNETIEHMAFSREGTLDATPKVTIQPQPQQACQYVITYLPGYQGDNDPLTAEVMMPEHVELLRLRIATALLPYSKWFEDEAENRVKRQDLAIAFSYQLQRKERNYALYKATIAEGRDTYVDYWN